MDDSHLLLWGMPSMGQHAQHGLHSQVSCRTSVGVEYHISDEVRLLNRERHIVLVKVQEKGVVLRHKRIGSGGVPEPVCVRSSSSVTPRVEMW